MARKKDKSEVEHLKGIIREQKSIIRNLKKQLGASVKRQHLFEEIEERYIEDNLNEHQERVKEIVATEEDKCPKCKSKLDCLNIGVRELIMCTKCDYRLTKKI